MEQDSHPAVPDLKDLIRQDIELFSRNKAEKVSLTMNEWLDMLQDNPNLAHLAHQRMYSIIKSHDYEQISHETDPRRAKLLGLEPGFVMNVPKLLSRLKGIEEVLFEIDNYTYIAAGQGEASRQMLYFWGPPSSSKSTIVEILRRALEKHGFWQLEGCEHHDSPVNATPRHLRKEIYEKFGIYIDPRADICPKCRHKLIEDYKRDYTKFKVEWREFSQRSGCGIGVVSEVDPINFNMAVLIGEEDISKLGDYPRGHPETLVLNGAFSKGQRGPTEFVEIWKNPTEAERPIITATQEKYVPLPKFSGQIYVDTMLISHSNETEWRKFKSDTTNEALMNRIYVVRVPYNLRLTEEVEIYRDSFLDRSDFKNIHIDPHALEQVAMFTLFTRLATDTRYSPLIKIKIRDGQNVLSGGEPINLNLDELLRNANPHEGMVGLSYRDAMKGIIEQSLAYYRCYWQENEYLAKRGGYLNAVWLRRAMIRYVTKLDIPSDGEWPKPSKNRWLAFIQDDLQKDFIQSVEKDLMLAHASYSGTSLKEKTGILLNLYTDNAISFAAGKPYDKKFLESVEEYLQMSSNEKEAFRKEIGKQAFSLRAEGHQISSDISGPLNYAVTTKIRGRLINDILDLIQDEGNKKKLIDALVTAGYAELGARIIIDYASEHLKRD